MTRVLIMGVPWLPQRTKRAVELARQTGGEVVWDRAHDAFDTFQLVLEEAGDEAVVILQDDVALAENWSEKVSAAIEEHPDDLINFFSLQSEKESGYRPGRTYLMNQCYYLPAGYASRLLEYSQDWRERHPNLKTGDDSCIQWWLKENKLSYWMHVPSLVQHEDWRSEINHKRPRNRQSKVFDA